MGAPDSLLFLARPQWCDLLVEPADPVLIRQQPPRFLELDENVAPTQQVAAAGVDVLAVFERSQLGARDGHIRLPLRVGRIARGQRLADREPLRYAASAPGPSPCATSTSPILLWLTERSRCHSVLAGSRAASASRIASPLRYAASAPGPSPCATSTSPILSWLTERSRCHSVLAGSRAASASAIASPCGTPRAPPARRPAPQHVADPVVAHREVALPLGVGRISLRTRLGQPHRQGICRHRRRQTSKRHRHVTESAPARPFRPTSPTAGGPAPTIG